MNRHNGTLTSPAFGHANYPHNQKCTFKIRHPEGGKLSMIFSYMDIHPTDYVQVRGSPFLLFDFICYQLFFMRKVHDRLSYVSALRK